MYIAIYLKQTSKINRLHTIISELIESFPNDHLTIFQKKHQNPSMHIWRDDDRITIETYLDFGSSIQRTYRSHDLIFFMMPINQMIWNIRKLLTEQSMEHPVIIAITINIRYLIPILHGDEKKSELCIRKLNQSSLFTVIDDKPKKISRHPLNQLIQAFDCDINPQDSILDLAKNLMTQRKKIYLVVDTLTMQRLTDPIGFTVISEEDVQQYWDEIYLRLYKEPMLPFLHLSIYNTVTEPFAYIRGEFNYVKLTPKRLILGVGCKKGTSFEQLLESLYEYLVYCNIHKNSIACIASSNEKKKERGIKKLANFLQSPIVYVDRTILEPLLIQMNLPGTQIVQSFQSLPNIAMPVAHHLSDGALVAKPYSKEGVSLCLAYSKN